MFAIWINVLIWEPRESRKRRKTHPGGADGGNNSLEGKYKHGQDYAGKLGGFVLIPGRVGEVSLRFSRNVELSENLISRGAEY